MPPDEAARVSHDQTNKAVVPPFVRLAAVAGLFAFFLGRTISPALRGARDGLDQIIAYTDKVGTFASYFFAFIGIIVTSLEVMLTSRERKSSIVYRFTACALGACVVSLIPYALINPLPEQLSIVAGLASGLVAILASREAIAVPRTRALGVLLFSAGVAALLHLAASVLSSYSATNPRWNLTTFARLVATGSVMFDALAVLTAFAWLATRSEKATVWSARAAVFVACTLAWGVAKGGSRENAPLWQLVAYRAIDPLLAHPAAYVWTPLRYALETSAPFLALAAVCARRQIPAVTGAIALALLARPTTDVPLSALALALAALAAPLAARDDRGMWAVLMANSERSPAPS
jgi:hypothetical protein